MKLSKSFLLQPQKPQPTRAAWPSSALIPIRQLPSLLLFPVSPLSTGSTNSTQLSPNSQFIQRLFGHAASYLIWLLFRLVGLHMCAMLHIWFPALHSTQDEFKSHRYSCRLSWWLCCVKSHSQRHTDQSKLCTVVYSLCLASVCSQVCLLCSTLCWPDFLSCSHQSGIPREKREQTEATERRFLQSTASLWQWFIVLPNLLNRFQEGGVYRFRDRSEVMFNPQTTQVCEKNKLKPSANLQTFPAHCKYFFCFTVWAEWRKRGVEEASISFEFTCMTLCQPMWTTPMLWYPIPMLEMLKPCRVHKKHSRLKV